VKTMTWVVILIRYRLIYLS